jgi:hypothetical protein
MKAIEADFVSGISDPVIRGIEENLPAHAPFNPDRFERSAHSFERGRGKSYDRAVAVRAEEKELLL